MGDRVESSAAKGIREGWRMVSKKNAALQKALRAGRAAGGDSYDGELDRAWFESQDGTESIVGGVRLFSFEESERQCAAVVSDPSRPPNVTNRKIFARPVGVANNGDLIALATIGRGNLYGKILRITAGQLAAPHYDPLSVVVDSAAKWIRKTFASQV